jgi:transposase
MALSTKYKEALVIDLVKKGHTTMEISKLANVSNTTIKKTKQKITKNANEKKRYKRKENVNLSRCFGKYSYLNCACTPYHKQDCR